MFLGSSASFFLGAGGADYCFLANNYLVLNKPGVVQGVVQPALQICLWRGCVEGCAEGCAMIVLAICTSWRCRKEAG